MAEVVRMYDEERRSLGDIASLFKFILIKFLMYFEETVLKRSFSAVTQTYEFWRSPSSKKPTVEQVAMETKSVVWIIAGSL